MTPIWMQFLGIFFLILPTKSWQLSTNRTCSNATLYEFSARSDSGTVHFLFAGDELVRPPALIIVYSKRLDSTVTVNCTKFQTKNLTEFRDSVRVDGHSASYGVLFYQACAYGDGENQVKVPDTVQCHTYLGHNLNWTTSIESQGTSHPTVLSALLRGTGHMASDQFLPGGSIKINFTVYAQDTKPSFPSYYDTVAGGLHVMIQIALDNLLVPEPWTRVAPVFFVFSNQSLGDQEDFAQLTGLFDGPLGKLESTFLLLDKRESTTRVGANSGYLPGFVEFPPLSYTTVPQSTTSQTDLRLASLGPRKPISHRGKGATKYSHSLVYAFYGSRFNQEHQEPHKDRVGAREQFVNLGSPGDGFYIATNYTAWTMVLGLGDPNLPSTAGTARVVWTVLTLFSLLFAIISGVICWRRKRAASQSAGLFRFERMNATLLPDEDSLTSPRAIGGDTTGTNELPTLRTAFVEPAQLRKLPFSFRWPSSRRRVGQHSHAPTDPLLISELPTYDSVVRQDLA